MLTPGGYGIGPFTPMVNSLRRITPAEAAAIRPRIIHVVTVAPGDTVQSLAEPDGLPRFQAGSVPVAQWLAAEQQPGAGAEGQAGRLRRAPQLTG